jgi:hypothetical protein
MSKWNGTILGPPHVSLANLLSTIAYTCPSWQDGGISECPRLARGYS